MEKLLNRLKLRTGFDGETLRALCSGFKKAAGQIPAGRNFEDEAEIFIQTLSGFSEALPKFRKFEPQESRRRREKVRAFAVALENLHAAMTKLDSAALGYAVYCGFSEIEKAGVGSNPLQPGMPAVFESAAGRDELLPLLASFSAGVRSASKTLPVDSFDYRLKTALAIEREFFDRGMKFTVSNSGFSAVCLRAVFELGGEKIDRVDYWLKMARDSEDSMSSFVKRYRNTADE